MRRSTQQGTCSCLQTARRDAIENDLHLIAAQLKLNKSLTGPRRMLEGPPPNPASLNPCFDRV